MYFAQGYLLYLCFFVIGRFVLFLVTYQYPDVLSIINEINSLHGSISKDLNYLLKFKLKKSVSSIVENNTIKSDFQEIINLYKEELNNNLFRISNIQTKYNAIRFRIKQAESISEKLLYYMNDIHENGKIPINKCLNDFLGFRILVDDLYSIYEILKNSPTINQKMRMYLREDDDYKGIHIYFKNGKNVYFPWELQIWDIKDSILNEKSHREHKQKRKYISLPQTYHDTELEKEE
jgi:hypothetical protein